MLNIVFEKLNIEKLVPINDEKEMDRLHELGYKEKIMDGNRVYKDTSIKTGDNASTVETRELLKKIAEDLSKMNTVSEDNTFKN